MCNTSSPVFRCRGRAMATFGKVIVLGIMGFLFGVSFAFAGMVEFRTGTQGTILKKPVKSMKEMRYTGIVRQKLDISCGTAALATILKYYYARDISEADVIADILNHGDRELIAQKGFSMLDLKLYAERTGEFRAEGFRVPFETLRKLQLPSIVLLDIKGFKHFVVLRGVLGDRVYISDPIIGRRALPVREFTEGWNGILLLVLEKNPQQANRPHEDLKQLSISKEEIWRIRDLYVGAPMLSVPFEMKN